VVQANIVTGKAWSGYDESRMLSALTARVVII
jgi:hypothetical protein